MPSAPLRFIHTSDLHLERPPHGLSEIPPRLREQLIDAPYASAERMFDAALAEGVDMVLLAGDVVHLATAGPRAIAFLVGQFDRLASAGIQVYWAGGRVDPPHLWPDAVALPDAVHRFPVDAPREVVHRQHEHPVARVIGQSSGRRARVEARQFLPHGDDVYSIALSYGAAKLADVERPGIDYWALGGLHGRLTLVEAPIVVHYPGSPQARHPEETGIHSATLVEVDANRRARLRPLATDVVRFRREQVAIDASTTIESLERMLDDRIRAATVDTPRHDCLILWRLVGEGSLATRLRRPVEAAQLLDRLRERHGVATQAKWSISLEVEPLPMPTANDVSARPGIIGDLFGLIRDQAEPDAPALALDALLTEAQLRAGVGQLAELTDHGETRLVLRRSTALALDLLCGGE